LIESTKLGGEKIIEKRKQSITELDVERNFEAEEL